MSTMWTNMKNYPLTTKGTAPHQQTIDVSPSKLRRHVTTNHWTNPPSRLTFWYRTP
ncbi:hypothetical protein PHYBLDRAFT_147367 [Phycomyces blakesleeanus NRRL 1555(-)]|uniref:Uncharacterized protein n=1 Tax=Phycomyces blakesleeanus (strain ATCC 8743b / DSM 1359 / FGSC 10004 / NBRC 33097 / NRRL 1555) TaxID=763407 RepID=A0A163DJ89_PHYB8|nr:hypothetical protein PHYBLDRAFT_147367 [Phycomyces blakesleeanus NRRL 1555(-)]OAD71620.1 hypothetical protein PHYBLDRAFT_147367 [Phycomyces blakesleeanus NRRL 1555(-)]|eukprot:XP_018289660.1 hypothetical protein PHYBLDRAFT_147367 [Phycomyces blakesleeanus NRRL 1555(-)]